MNYYILKNNSDVNGVLAPGLDGSSVKGYEDFFDNEKCTITTFYDKEYKFDYLTPVTWGEFEVEPEIIIDFHKWIKEQPMRGLFYPISEKFKELLEEYNLPQHKFYEAKVLFQNKYHPYYVWHLIFQNYLEYIDFQNTRYNNLNSFRKLKQDKLEIKQFSSYNEMRAYSRSNWSRSWNYEKIVMKSSFRDIDYCYVSGLNGGNLVSERLKIAIEEAGLTGVEFEDCPVPIELSDEVG